MANQVIYKIVSKAEWKEAVKNGVFRGAAIDLEDGYIHFSSAEQVEETAKKHFSGQSDLLLVTVSESKLGDSVRWEESRGGQLFPHLYSDLLVSIVDDVFELPLGDDDQHVFPERN